MNYKEARTFIQEISVRGSMLGMETVTNLLALLGNPQDDLKFIHIAGTNGKGSVLAYLSTILEQAGYLVGRYISPTLFSYRERIQINRENISREDFAALASQVCDAYREMERRGMALPTVFEVETAISFLYFRKKGCDLVMLETGLGGRLDATNVIKTPVLTMIASISMDHMEFLGDTIEQIAWNKAGIIKPHVPVVCAHQSAGAKQVIVEEADKQGSGYTFVQPQKITDICYGMEEQSFVYGDFGRIVIHLAGRHQIENAALALEGVAALRRQGYEISDGAVVAGMEQTVWKGRFTAIHQKPLVILDGAHNPDAASRLRDSVEMYFKGRKKYYIFGVFSDKEYDKIIDITAGLAERIYTVQTPGNPRALPAQKLAEAVARVNPSVEACGDIKTAVEKSFALSGDEDVILVFGSLSFLAEAEQAVEQYERVYTNGEQG
ncbi:bifunctional folylpolyglutamate synthase/dihydrofolate synthase [Parablautia sp. Marseille-Q6255]|uniref:bifunctional folylpolyglutamate synthase/dihydrofolate synthase n=1 Tax=Parablautia sp. Marseille-Q6255 TaxID=3039593 RepID=UPI0024BC5B85|nr:folylpolyglutamate synthase/dihydrofolate synthase family protein [Parablautia sp. Marseille-Q6255]